MKSDKAKSSLYRKLMHAFLSQMKKCILKSNRNLLSKVKPTLGVRLKARHIFLSLKLLAGEFLSVFAVNQLTFLRNSIFALQQHNWIFTKNNSFSFTEMWWVNWNHSFRNEVNQRPYNKDEPISNFIHSSASSFQLWRVKHVLNNMRSLSIMKSMKLKRQTLLWLKLGETLCRFVISLVLLFIIVVLIFGNTFCNWWLSYWINQGGKMTTCPDESKIAHKNVDIFFVTTSTKLISNDNRFKSGLLWYSRGSWNQGCGVGGFWMESDS